MTVQYTEGQTMKAVYHDGLVLSATVVSKRQVYRGPGHPTTTGYTVEPHRAVMGEEFKREFVLISEDMIIEE